jgi:hypothetical protein
LKLFISSSETASLNLCASVRDLIRHLNSNVNTCVLRKFDFRFLAPHDTHDCLDASYTGLSERAFRGLRLPHLRKLDLSGSINITDAALRQAKHVSLAKNAITARTVRAVLWIRIGSEPDSE